MSAARDLIERMWAADPDPVRTLAIKAEIDAALFRDDVAHDVGHFDRCPWSPIYLAKRPVRIGRKQLHPLQQFTYDVTLGGQAVLTGQQGQAVLEGGAWKVSDAGFCQLLALENGGSTSGLPPACGAAGASSPPA